MKKIIHLIPYDATGGVEVAARSMSAFTSSEFEFSVWSIYPHVPAHHQRRVTYGVRPLLDAVRRIQAQAPDLLIVSLWRASLVGTFIKLIRPDVRLVLMLHSTKHAHWLDKLITMVTGRLADEWWGDSTATLYQRLAGSRNKIKRVISFVTRRLQPVAAQHPTPNFIFWGRLSVIKGLDRAIQLFAKIVQSQPNAHFTLIGPDGGALEALRELVIRMGLQHLVSFPGEMDIRQICSEASSASFYLQASKYEGMAMSVVEAMQLGLVPIVTPVGEIRNYCKDGENGVLIQSDDTAVEQVLNLLACPDLYLAMQDRAVATWQHSPIYADSILEACRGALSNALPAAR